MRITQSIGGRLVGGYLAVLVLLAVAWAVAAASTATLRAHFTHTVDTLDALSANVVTRSKLLDDEETGLRGYLLTGSREFLQPYTAAQRVLPALRERAVSLGAGEAGARPLLAALLQRERAWEAWARRVLAGPMTPPTTAAAVAQQRAGKALFDRLRAAADGVTRYLNGRRNTDLQASVGVLDDMNAVFTAIFVGALALTAVIGWLTTRAVTRPLQRLRLAAAAIGRGDLDRPVELPAAVEFTRLAQGMDEMRRQLASQRSLAALVGSTLRFEEIYAQFATQVRELARYDHLNLSVRERDDAPPVIAYVTGVAAPALAVGTSLPLDTSLAGRVYQTGQPFICPDLHALSPDQLFGGVRSLRDAGIRAVAVVPLLTKGAVVGTLSLGSLEAGTYDGDNLAPITALAPLIAAAVDNARLYRRLDLANAELSRASRVKSDFLASMSHELRTPLNAIIGFSEVLQDGAFGSLNERQHRYVGNVLEAGRHLLRLVNDILDISKVEAGRMELHYEDVELDALLADACRVIQPLAQQKSIELSLPTAGRETEAPGAVLVRVDRARFLQILYNLLSNAVKFTPSGGAVTLSYSALPESVAIAVTDSGIGIAPEDQERIFDEFQQVASAARTQEHGTGLGLALTRRLVELHGGSIAVRSALGHGSTFTITVPRSVQAPAHGEHGDVLVVEDQPAARELLILYLAEAGYGVQWVERAAEVLPHARAMQPVAITFDLMLEGETAWWVLEGLKADAATRDIPVVIVSIVDEQAHGFALGAAAYLVKPVTRQDLQDVLRRVTGGAAQPVRVLAVDDQPEALELIALALEQGPYVLRRAGGGEEALRLLAEERPDVMIVDLLMAPISGFDLIATIAADPALKDIPIIVLTNRDLSSDDVARLNGHIMAALPKHSFSKARFLSELQRATRGRLAVATALAPRDEGLIDAG